MNFEIINMLFSFSGGFLALLMSLGQFFQRKKRFGNYLIMGCTFCISVVLFSLTYRLIETGANDTWSCIVDAIGITAYSTAGPFFFLGAMAVVRPYFPPRLVHILFFLPTLLIGIMFTVLFFNSYEYVISIKDILNVYLIVSTATYCLVVFFRAVRLSRGSSKENRKVILNRISLIIALLIILSILSNFFRYTFPNSHVITVLLILVYLLGQRYPDYLQILREESRKAQYSRSKIQNLNVDVLLERLSGCMNENKIYRDENLSLGKLAQEIKITSHQLSELLNVFFHKSFPEYINELRVKEAKELLLSNNEASIISICYTVGFNSQSAFYRAFKRYAGISPGTFRNQNNVLAD